MTLSLRLRVFANNEVRATFADMPVPRKYAGDCMHAKREERIAEALAYLHKSVVGTGKDKYLLDPYMSTCTKLSQKDLELHEEQRKRSLDIISEFQRSHNRYRADSVQTVNRPTRFTLNARRTILEAAQCLDSTLAHPSDAAVVTLTLPGGGDSAHRTIASHSGYICNLLLQQVRRHHPNALWFYCWELQKRGALHLHLCVSSDSGEASLDAAERIRYEWVKLLKRLEERIQTGLCTSIRGNYCYLPEYWQNDVQPLHKSVGGYFGKYCSKSANGANPTGKGFAGIRVYSPKRWWGCSRKLLALVKSRRRDIVLKGFSRDTFNKIRLMWVEFMESVNPVVCHSFDFEVGSGLGRVSKESFDGQPNRRVFGVGHTHISYHNPSMIPQLHEEITTFVSVIAASCEGLLVALQGCSNNLLKSVLNPVITANRLVRTNSVFTDSLVIM